MTTLDEMNPDWSGMARFIQARKESPPWASESGGPREARQWNPYSFEGGTIAAIAGPDFAVLASDTRMSQNESAVLNRKAKKLFTQNESSVFGGCMFYGDMVQLERVLKAEAMRYSFDFHEEMSVDVMAELLARLLYNRRFFPYYAWTMMGGIDADGKGAVYSYDPIGCLERVPYVVAGNGRNLVEPILVNQVMKSTQMGGKRADLTKEQAQKILQDALIAAAERETCTGDSIHIVTLEKGKAPVEKFVALRQD